MIVALIHIDSNSWHERWPLVRKIADDCNDSLIKLDTKVLGGGTFVRIRPKYEKDSEAFGIITKDVLAIPADKECD